MNTSVSSTVSEFSPLAGKTGLILFRQKQHMIRTDPLIVMGGIYDWDFPPFLLFKFSDLINYRGGYLKVKII